MLVPAHNTQNTYSDPTAHGEINALRILGKQKVRNILMAVWYSAMQKSAPCVLLLASRLIYAFYYGAPAEPLAWTHGCQFKILQKFPRTQFILTADSG